MRLIEISCVEVWRQISDYLDDEVDAEMRARLEAHFKVCDHCAAIVDGARNVVKIVGNGTVFELPKGFSDRMKERLDKEIKK